MRFPPFLKKNGTIGIIAPSFGCTIEPYRTLCKEAVRRFEADGYRVVLGPNVEKEEGIGKSNTPEACAAEINAFFAPGETDVLISAGGGETMCEDLSFVDFDALKDAPPKWFMGYSDNTNLVFPLTTICDTAAIYGPNISDFAQNPRHPAVTDALSVLTGERAEAEGTVLTVHNYDAWEKEEHPEGADLFLPYNATEPNDFRIYIPSGKGAPLARELGKAGVSAPGGDNRKEGVSALGGDNGKEGVSALGGDNGITGISALGSKEGQTGDAPKTCFSGRLVGGCLDILQLLVGTRFDRVKAFTERYKDDGLIWFLEACDLNPVALRRALWQLSEAGWFENTRGFLIGRPTHFGETAFGMDMETAVIGALAQYGVPILLNLDIGHLPPMMPLISGALATVTAQEKQLSIEMKLV